jgi:hypothetical protein
LAPDFYADGTGLSFEGGLCLPVEVKKKFKFYGYSTVRLQECITDAHKELDLSVNLKGRGEFKSLQLPQKNILSDISRLLTKKDGGPYRVGIDFSFGTGWGIINYWRSDTGYVPLKVFSFYPGAGVFLDTKKCMLNLDFCYQIDFTDASPRTFITIPLSVTVHTPVFRGRKK